VTAHLSESHDFGEINTDLALFVKCLLLAYSGLKQYNLLTS